CNPARDRRPPHSFPTRRSSDLEALLVKLADVLRRYVAGREPAGDPLWLTISRCPWVRLSIDEMAHVAYLSEVDTFHAAIEAGPEDRKSTRLNSSHVKGAYAVFC